MNEKDIHNFLREISHRMAKEYNLDLRIDDFPNEGNYRKVQTNDDEEAKELQKQLKDRGIDNIGTLFSESNNE